MINYSEFEELANKYSLHTYKESSYISDEFYLNDELMEYIFTGGYVKFYPQITLYEGNVEVMHSVWCEIHTPQALENKLKEFVVNSKKLKILAKKKLIEKDFK